MPLGSRNTVKKEESIKVGAVEDNTETVIEVETQ